ncbi:putative surface-anchored protein [Corynebacterium glutamicum]|uniref:SpaH/EbpB family LPXTG-anchored major pilin n=1 Tax=Corynebacterium glutamicum TaxID=1718 RepID=UPI00097EBAEA|nr:SpaH/EbpB family LPXTG-anchored major pilin [Corynebacterium glutamicum]SJM51302.1 putative surface-anchored protein [Corynebacterium glutamicum]
MNKNHKRISAAVLALALGFSAVGAPVLAPMAGAQPIEIEAGDVSTIDTSKTGSLTINKFKGLPLDDQEADPSDTLEGMEADFTVQQVTGIDLTTEAGWTTLNGLIQAVDENNSAADLIGNDPALELGTGKTQKTLAGNDYSTTFDNLALGVYLVTETAPTGYQGAAPFFVTLPSPNSDGNGWDYEVTVQPKNQSTIQVEKSVQDVLAAVGTVSTYTIKMAIPDKNNLESIRVLDTLPTELNNIANVTVTGNGASVAYTSGSQSATNVLDLMITDPGALQGQTLTVEFDAEIVSAPQTPGTEGGVIENSASIDIVIDGVTYNFTTDPEDPTETRLGQLTIGKVDGSGAAITGSIAEFELWRCTDQGEAPDVQWALADGPLTIPGTPDPTTRFETNPTTGIAVIENIQMANFVNGKETPASNTMCVVEVQAPAGYVLNPEPQPVLEMDDDNFTMSVDVTNLKDDGAGQLPSTGGMGTMALIAGGLLVAVAGGFAALRGNRARG